MKKNEKSIRVSMKERIRQVKKELGIAAQRVGYHGIKWCQKNVGLKVTEHGGKLEGMHSLSTTCCCNPYCKARMEKEDLVCHECFSEALQKMRKELRASLENNFRILTSRILESDELPLLNDIISRIESFGDLYNVIQAINYIHYCEKNAETTFGWWTKNLAILKKGLEVCGYHGAEKPKNVIIIYSSPKKNVEVKLEDVQKNYPFVDKVFTVFSPEYIVEHPELIPTICCGAKQCMACRLCYSHNNVKQIREILK